jgi:transcriptional regulator with XRE-family HTH domain
MCDNLNFMSNIGQNIKNLRVQKGLSQKALAKLCGWDSNSRIANYEGTGATKREPTLSDIKRIAAILNVSAAALAFDDFTVPGEIPVPIIKGLPILKSEHVKDWPINKGEVIKDANLKFLHNHLTFGLNCFAYEIEDDSMFNFITHEGFRKGKQVIVDPDKKYNTGDYILVKRKNGALLFRKIIEEDNESILMPLNNLGYYAKTKFSEDMKICGVIIAYLDILS